MNLLSVRHLSVGYETPKGLVRAVDDISFDVHKGKPLGIVGESGCGKTTIGMTLMGLLPDNARVLGGQILFSGLDLAALNDSAFREVRGKALAMIFQAAMNALNPVLRVGEQIREAVIAHSPSMPKADSDRKVRELCDLVELPHDRMGDYPHEFSGGMKQRAVIAMALACTPSLVIADEPTTALDVIVQDQILKSLRAIQARMRTGLILISHDIAVVASICDHICVMYGGQIVEAGERDEVFGSPAHPYTRMLLGSYLSLSAEAPLIPSMRKPPDLTRESGTCRFADNCSSGACTAARPRWVDITSSHRVFCCDEALTGTRHGSL